MHRTSGINNIDTAKLCFQENLELFGDPTMQTEKHNLYKGLYMLAATIETMQIEIEQLKMANIALQQQLSQHR
jgi:hypothetical protein